MVSIPTRKKLRTGIICTLGPASEKEDVLERMILGGMSVARLNFSHGTHQEHFARMEKIRKLSGKLRRKVRILQDLEGFRIRLGRFAQPKTIEKGDAVCLTNSKATGKIYVPFDYEGDLRIISKGMNIFIDDGKIVLKSRRASKDTVICDVVVGGVLLPRKGVNIPALELDFEGVTPKDISDVGFAVMHGVDFIAQSFVRTADDVNRLREQIGSSLKRYKLIAKIESVQALHNIDKIIDAADMIMIARGDMGVVIPVYQVPFVQKEIIRKCRAKGKPVITATQMLESMTDNIIPTRAEVADVANAVLDGTDYVMLSGETAKGKYPVRAVEMMADTVRYTEAYMSASRFLILPGVEK